MFYPVPTLCLVDYDYGDKRNGLTNNMARVKVQTLGPKQEVFFEFAVAEEVGKGFQLGSSQDSLAELTTFAKGAAIGVRIIRAYDSNNTETGRLRLVVVKPIPLKICFVKVGYHDTKLQPGGGPLWSYRDDRYLEMLGQAGVIFDDIAEASMALEGIPERWDPELKDDLLDDTGMDLNTFLDGQFTSAHPEYAGYYRVYILDKFKVERESHGKLRFITHQLRAEDPHLSPLVLFKKSIEAADARESNPLAHGMLCSFGLDLQLAYDQDNDVRTELLKGTTTNMMDTTKCRYTLTNSQWIVLRMKAMELQGQLEAAQKKAKKEAEKNHG